MISNSKSKPIPPVKLSAINKENTLYEDVPAISLSGAAIVVGTGTVVTNCLLLTDEHDIAYITFEYNGETYKAIEGQFRRSVRRTGTRPMERLNYIFPGSIPH